MFKCKKKPCQRANYIYSTSLIKGPLCWLASQSLSSISLKVELPPFKLLFPKVRLLFYPFDYINYK